MSVEPSRNVEPYDTLFLVNPNANNGKVKDLWKKLHKKIYTGAPNLEAMGRINCHVTESAEEAIASCRKGILQGVKKIIAVGGDGTIHNVLRGMITDGDLTNHAIEFGIMPLGACNDFAMNLDLKVKILQEALEQLATGPSKAIDVGRVTYTTDDGDLEEDYFLNMVSIGLSAEVAKNLNLKNKKFTSLNYLNSLRKTWKTYKNPVILFAQSCEDAKDQITSVKTAVIANGRYSCDEWMLAPVAELDDGKFDITIIEKIKKTGILNMKNTAKKGGLLDQDGIIAFTAEKLRVSSINKENVTIEINGYTPGKLPASFDFLPSRLRVITG